MPSQFYVQPADIATPAVSALRGIGGAFQAQSLKEEEEAQKQEMLQELSDAYESGTYDDINELSIKYPEHSKAILTQGKFKSEQTMQNHLKSMMIAYQNPDQIDRVVQSGVKFLQQQGASEEEIARRSSWGDKYREDPEKMKKLMLDEISFMATPEQWKQFKDVAGVEGTDSSTAAKQKTGGFLVRDPDTGETKVAVGVFDTETGTLQTETASFGADVIVSKLGETGREESARKVGQAAGTERATATEKRANELMQRGILAAESTAVLHRGLELLETVETGGIDAVALAAKRIFGVEGADEGELSRSLGKAVLAQLRSTFGAQFTEREGARLERLEAGFGKSVSNNKRILQQTLKIVERTARRAMKAAESRGDKETVDDIQGLLDFRLSTEVTPEPIAAPEAEAGAMGAMTSEQLKAIAFGGQQ